MKHNSRRVHVFPRDLAPISNGGHRAEQKRISLRSGRVFVLHLRRWAARTFGSSYLLFGGFLNEFGVDGNGHVVANDNAAVVHGGVPLDAKILAINSCGGIDGDSLVAPGILDGSGGAVNIQNGFFRDSVDGEIASNFESAGSDLLNLFGLKGDGGVVLDVEEMIAAEVLIAGLDARIDGIRVDGDVDRRFCDVLVVEQDGTIYFGECPANRGDRQVLD